MADETAPSAARNDRQWLISMHESAHAVAAYLFGVRLLGELSIVEDQDSHGRGRAAWPLLDREIIDAHQESRFGRFVSEPTRSRVEQWITYRVVGDLVAIRVLGVQDYEPVFDQLNISTSKWTYERVQAAASGFSKGSWKEGFIRCGSDDNLGALNIAVAVSGSPDEGAAYFWWLRHRALNLVQQPEVWSAIEALARELLVRGSLPGEAAEQVLDERHRLRKWT
jgi:hypothetical protein